MSAARFIGGMLKSAIRSIFVGILALSIVGGVVWAANYTATQGTGTTFASAVISAVNYTEFLLCDATAGATQCAAINSSGEVAVQAPSGAVASGAFASGSLASGAGTDGWNVTEGAKADSVCGTATGSCSEIALLKYLNNAVGGPIPPATAPYGIIGGVINGADTYNTIAASQSTQALTGGSGGATGDYLSHCTIVPATTAPGVVTILDNATAIYSYPGGGTTALLSLIPFSIPIGAVSVSGAWKVTTGANVSVVCVGKFH